MILAHFLKHTKTFLEQFKINPLSLGLIDTASFFRNPNIMAPIPHNENNSKGIFCLKENKISAALTFFLKVNAMTINYTEADPKQEGKGLKTALVRESCHFAKEKGRKIHPLYLFAEVLFDKNDYWNRFSA